MKPLNPIPSDDYIAGVIDACGHFTSSKPNASERFASLEIVVDADRSSVLVAVTARLGITLVVPFATKRVLAYTNDANVARFIVKSYCSRCHCGDDMVNWISACRDGAVLFGSAKERTRFVVAAHKWLATAHKRKPPKSG